ARLLRRCEVVREVRADPSVARSASDLDGRLVDIGDLTLGADRDQGVQARLDEAAGVLRGRPQLLLGPYALADVARDRGGPDDVAIPIMDGRHAERYRDGAPILLDAYRLVVIDPLALADPLENGGHLVSPV